MDRAVRTAPSEQNFPVSQKQGVDDVSHEISLFHKTLRDNQRRAPRSMKMERRL